MTTVQRKTVLNLIDECIADEEQKDKVTVLPLMCGTGKSTAISGKIAEVINNLDEDGNGDGILIVTDTIKGLNGYMTTYDNPTLNDFLKQKKKEGLIKIVHSKSSDTLSTHSSAPVLMITTQRYFMMDKDQIRSLLNWEHGKRTAIIIDEAPYFLDGETLDLPALCEHFGQILTLMAFSEQYNSAQRQNSALKCDATNCITDLYLTRKDDTVGSNDEAPVTYLYREPVAVPKGNENLTNRYSEDDPEYKYEEDYIQSILNLYENEPIRAAINKLLNDNQLNQKRNSYRMIKALNVLIRNGAIQVYQPNRSYHINAFLPVWNNKDLLTDLPAKVIILDGTGDVNPDYGQDFVFCRDCHDFRRVLSKLRIHIINYDSNKLKTISAVTTIRGYAELFRNYVVQLHNSHHTQETHGNNQENHLITTKDIPVFTYKAIEPRFKQSRPEDDEPDEVIIDTAHFGNIKGRNDFVDNHVFIQIGLLRFPDYYYLSRYLQLKQELFAELAAAEPADFTRFGPDYSIKVLPDSHISSITTSDDFKNYCLDTMLVDLEQNIFRGSIRIADSPDTEDYYLFLDKTAYSSLIDKLRKRFVEAYGAVLDIIPEDSFMQEIRQLSNDAQKVYGNRPTQESTFRSWYNALSPAARYTRNTAANALHLSKEQFKDLIKSSAYIKSILQQDQIGKSEETQELLYEKKA